MANQNIFNSEGELNGTPVNQWVPKNFSGTLDGKGHTISGLYVNETQGAGCLFDVFSGTIKNLNIADSYIKGEKGTATFARFVHTGSKISNCSSNAIVDGTIYSGGIAGESRGIIENCYFIGKLTSTDITSSAIVSECTDEYYTENTVTNCY